MRNLLKVFIAMGILLTMSGFIKIDKTILNQEQVQHEADLPLEGTPSDDPNFGTGTIYNYQSMTDLPQLNAVSYYLRDGKAYISSAGNYVYVSGDTYAYRPVERISIRLVLEYWNADRGVWVPIDDEVWTDYLKDHVMGHIRYTVPSGYFYRTRARHWINHGTYNEELIHATPYIYIRP